MDNGGLFGILSPVGAKNVRQAFADVGFITNFVYRNAVAKPEDMNLTKEQSLNLKGYAITLIMIHNYVDHVLSSYCNEMGYHQAYTDAFMSRLWPVPSVWHCFAFAGWIGVAVFLMLSGYGLTRKYGQQPIDRRLYVRRHATKLWLLLIPVYLLFVLIYHFGYGEPHNLLSVIAQCSFTINLFSYGDNGLIMEPGVYWFFGVILQLYLLFLALRRVRTAHLWMLLAAFIGFQYFTLYCTNDDFMWWARQNFMGWGAPFVLGMIMARTPQADGIGKRWLLLGLPLLLAGLLLCLTVKWLTPLTEVVTALAGICVVRLFTLRVIAWLGVLSPSIFVIHPLVRMVCYHSFVGSSLPFAMTVAIYFVIAVSLSMAHRYLLNRVTAAKK